MPSIKKKYTKDAGELVHRIQIQRKTVSKPVNGIVNEFWKTIYSPRCSVSNNTGKSYYKETTELYDRLSKAFVFRTHPTVEIKAKDIIIYDGERWEIIYVFDYDDNRVFTKAIAYKCEQ